jgi:membrane fusion protein (multidrug efflux system)
MMVVQTGDLWITANFKETQLARMHPGQRVKIAVDALHREFNGTVESMPAVTGSRTSVLPPENATGNYVKVIQRMPVRIRLEPAQQDSDKLRPGMSVEPKVYVGN